MLSESARNLFIEMMPLGPEEREEHLRQRAAADEGETGELLALLRALDGSPGFLEVSALAWSASADETPWIMPEFGAGARFGSFTLVREVGRGGMGVVYEARQERPRRRVALKLMRPGPYSRSDLARFKREAEALGRLNHPHIAAVYEARMLPADGGGEHTPYIAMEFIEGCTIAEHVRERGLGIREVVRLMVDACDGAAHAHEAGIVHRDLSVSNVLVDGAGRVKIVDFGVARLGEADAAGSLASVGGHVFGKWATMSPEQAAGDPARIDARTDVFALGAVLYELLAGRPWLDATGKSAVQLIRAVERDEPAPIGSLRREARGDLQAVIATAMNKDRMRRYQSAADLRDELMRWLDGLPVHAREPGTLERSARFASRNRALVGAAAGTFAALSIALAFATTQWIRASQAEREIRRTVSTVIENVAAALNRTRLSADLRAAALAEIRPAVERMLKSSPQDPDVRTAAARYHIESALVEGYYYTVNRGNRDAALEHFERALTIAAPDGIARVRSESVAFAAMDAINRREEMRRLSRRMNPGEERELLDAVALCDRMLPRTADPLGWLRFRVWTACNVMERNALLGAAADNPAIQAAARHAIQRYTPADPTPAQHLAIANCLIALISGSTKAGLCDGIPDDCVLARRYVRVSLDQESVDPDEYLTLADAYRYQSACLTAMGRAIEAEEHADNSVAVARELTQRSPQRSNVWSGLIVALSEQANVRASLVRVDALDSIDEAIGIAESRADETGASSTVMRQLANLSLKRAEIIRALQQAGHSTDADGRPLNEMMHEALDRLAVRAESIDAPAAAEIRAAADRFNREAP